MNQELTKNNPENTGEKLAGVGELLKRSWQIYKENFGVLIKITFVPLFLGGLLLVAGVFYSFSFSVRYFLFQAISNVLFSLIFCWLTVSLVFAVKNREKKIDFKEALKSGTKWIFPLFWIGILSSMIVYGGMIFLIIPGIILTIWFCLTSYTLIYEDKRGMDALLKSKDLISGNWWAVFWRNIVIFGVGLLISLPFDLLLFSFLFLLKEMAFTKYDYVLYVLIALQFLPLLFLYSFQIIYFALIYENLQEIKEKLEFKATLKRKLKYFLPGILGVVIVGIIGGLIFWGLHSGYKSMKEEVGGKEVMDLAKTIIKIEMYYNKEAKYPGVFGSNQWNILESELKTDLPKGNYEYWVSDDNQRAILKTRLESWSMFLDGDIDGYPLGENAVFCGFQGKDEREYCIGIEKTKVITQSTPSSGRTETDHFVIHHQGTELSEETINILNNSYFRISGDLGISNSVLQFIGDERINVLIYKDSSEYHKSTGRPSWSQGFNDYESRSLHLIKETDFNTVIPHEMAHLLFKDQFPDNRYYIYIPDWIHESIAFYEEEKFDDSYVKSRLLPQLEIIKKGNYLTYSELLEKSPSETGEKNYLWYAQSLSMTKYLINEYGVDRFLELSNFLGESDSIDEALWKSYQNTKLVEKMGTQALNEILIERWFEYVKNRDNL